MSKKIKKPKEKKKGMTPWHCSSFLAMNAIHTMIPQDADKVVKMNCKSLHELFGLLCEAVYEDLNIAQGNV